MTEDPYETYVKLFAKHESDLRRFLRSLLPTAIDTDEVLQQTAIVAWKKFDQFDPDTNFMKWACVIGRYEALAYRRKMARDRLVFREDILELMADEGEDELDQLAEERDALEFCLGELSYKQRQLVLLAHTPGIKVKELAEEAGATAPAFYMKVNRLRKTLVRCIEKKMGKKEAGLA